MIELAASSSSPSVAATTVAKQIGARMQLQANGLPNPPKSTSSLSRRQPIATLRNPTIPPVARSNIHIMG